MHNHGPAVAMESYFKLPGWAWLIIGIFCALVVVEGVAIVMLWIQGNGFETRIDALALAIGWRP